jgi:hypothetical protein
MNMNEKFQMVGECTTSYRVKELGKDGIEIFIKIPKRFESLWMHTLSDLETTMKEIEYYESDD